ncbi:CpaF family protein [Isoptericola jiangsuensis]|uniref:CpaF family protein n=1 Tax=Isoptericola jiangsuensis TaxID=548579 RepID=UPI003AB06326
MALRDRIVASEKDTEDHDLASIYRERLLEEIDVDELARLSPAQRRVRLERMLSRLLSLDGPILSARERSALVQRIVDDALGLGVLEPLLADESVTEIMVNGPEDIFVERSGQVQRVPTRFASAEQLYQTIDRIVSSVNRRVDESSPMVDARLPTGERVNVIIPPLALDGPTMTIRRFPTPFRMGELVGKGSLDEQTASLLSACVRARLNIVVSGGTGSGKTTFLNALSGLIPDHERIVTIEDAAELSLQQGHVVRLESRPANVEGRGAVTIRDLVRNALRMRPDRVIVGEVRGGETMDMLQAMNTGHDGSLATVHANSAFDALGRLETLASMSELDLPVTTIRDQINSAIDVVIHLARGIDGSRRVVEVQALVSERRGDYQMAPLAEFVAAPVGPDHVVSGRFMQYTLPEVLRDRLRRAGETAFVAEEALA